MTIYLYVKTHNITGLKYLGKTVNKDPHKYKGSGKRWINHIKIHGYNVTTIIIKECKTSDELIFWGRYYSDLWNVVASEEWANLKPEEGQGFATGKYNPMFDPVCKKKHHDIINSMEVKQKQIKKLKASLSTAESKLKRSIIQKEVSKRPEIIEARKKYLESAEFKNKVTGVNSPAKRPEVRKKRSDYMRTYKNPSHNPDSVKKRYSENSKLVDHNNYVFHNDDGRIFEGKRQDFMKCFPEVKSSGLCMLVKGSKKKYKGWKLINL